MGGKVFATHSPPLPTPRLAPAEYHAIRATLLSRLSQYYSRLAVPIEAPNKTSFGDVDILIADPKYRVAKAGGWLKRELPSDESLHSQLPIITSVLQSVARIDNSFAVPKHVHLVAPAAAAAAKTYGVDAETTHVDAEPTYVQVDITFLSLDKFSWHFFMHCHGDIWNMLGPSLRRVGLVITHNGICVLHRDVEKADRKRARIVLSRDCEDVLSFLGLCSSTFWGSNRIDMPRAGEFVANEDECSTKLVGRSFHLEADLFAFVSTSHFFEPTAYKLKSDLRARDRRRIAMRDSYRRFCEEWVPQHCPAAAEEADSDGETSVDQDLRHQRRDAIIAEALDHFGKRPEWDALEYAFRTENAHLELKRVGRELKKEHAQWVNLYADAWIESLRMGGA